MVAVVVAVLAVEVPPLGLEVLEEVVLLPMVQLQQAEQQTQVAEAVVKALQELSMVELAVAVL
jgi:hypothetical protein